MNRLTRSRALRTLAAGAGLLGIGALAGCGRRNRSDTRMATEECLPSEGVIVTETSSDSRLTAAIRAHAGEVSGFVGDGMQAMMPGMMGSAG